MRSETSVNLKSVKCDKQTHVVTCSICQKETFRNCVFCWKLCWDCFHLTGFTANNVWGGLDEDLCLCVQY